MIAAIIQARMGSNRLPGKVLADICGKPMLWHIIERLTYSKWVEKIIIATTTLPEDNPIIELADRCGVSAFAGSDKDVLDRFYQASIQFNADPIVRITADCPIIDPFIVDEVIKGYLEGVYEMYYLDGSFPDGLDTEVFSLQALKKAWQHAKLPSEREHVTPFIKNISNGFKIGTYEKFRELGHLRWTVDEERDLDLIRVIYSRLYRHGEIFTTDEILSLIESEPELQTINSMIPRNEGYAKSLAEDSIRGEL